jgi:hypothetical protein
MTVRAARNSPCGAHCRIDRTTRHHSTIGLEARARGSFNRADGNDRRHGKAAGAAREDTLGP